MSEFAIMTKGLSKAFGIGVLLLAREAGMDIDLRADLDTLIQQDFRISNDLYQTLLGRR